MIEKEEYISHLKTTNFMLFIFIVLTTFFSIYMTIKCANLQHKMDVKTNWLNFADSVNAINAQNNAKIQAQFDSTTKHIRPYQNR